MAVTRYFEEQVLRKRPYLSVALCREVLCEPIRVVHQADGRIRHWGRVRLQSEVDERILRAVTLADGETLHNAFLYRGFRQD